MPLGMEVGLGPGDIVLDGDPAPLPTERGTVAPTHTFWPMSIVAKRSPTSAAAELFFWFFTLDVFPPSPTEGHR